MRRGGAPQRRSRFGQGYRADFDCVQLNCALLVCDGDLTALSLDTPTPDSLQLDRQLCFAVYAAAHAYGRLYAPLLAPLGLTYPQYLVMLVLWEGAPLSVAGLGRRLHLDSGTLTPLLKRLEARGLVTRRRNSRDERQVLIGPTEAGTALRDRAATIPAAIGQASGGDVEKIMQLRQTLAELRTQLAGWPTTAG